MFQQRRQWQPTPVLLPGKSHGWRSLVGWSPSGREESDTTGRLHFHFSLSCIGGRNGNPLQCSCLENPRDGGAWWAAVYVVAQSRTRLKRLSSSSSNQVSRTWLPTPAHPKYLDLCQSLLIVTCMRYFEKSILSEFPFIYIYSLYSSLYYILSFWKQQFYIPLLQ